MMSGEIVLSVLFGRKSKKINYTTEKQRHFVFGNQCSADWIEKSISFGSSHFVPLQHEQKHEKSNSYCWAIAIWHSDHTHFPMVRCKISLDKKKQKKNLMTRRVLTKAFIKGGLHFGKSFQFDLRCCGSNSLSHFAWESARWSSWWQPHSHCHTLSWDIKIRTLIKKASNLMACGFTVVLPKFPLIQLLGKHNGI